MAPPRRIWQGRAGDLLSSIQLRSGRILLPISWQTPRPWNHRGAGFAAFTDLGQYDSSVLYSDDDGAGWHLSSSVLRVPTPDIGALGGVEPVVIQLRDGRVWMLLRTELGRFYESFSNDGSIWTEPRPSAIMASESPAALLRLGDGRLLLFVNNCQRFPYAFGGRHVLHAAISDDEGRSWHGYREVMRDPLRGEPPPPKGDFGAAYPFVALTRTGEVIFSLGVASGTRSQWPEGLDGPAHDEQRSLTRFSPAWLDELEHDTDFRHGANDWSFFGTRGVAVVNASVLRISRPDPAWPSGAVWNFPSGQIGTVHLRVRCEPGAPPILLGLTDHFSVPWDAEDEFHDMFNYTLQAGGPLSAGGWHDLELHWNCARRECRVRIDHRPQSVLVEQVRPASQGICYLRLRCTGQGAGAMLLQSARVRVSPAEATK